MIYFEVFLGVVGILLLDDLFGVFKFLLIRFSIRFILEFIVWSLELFNIVLFVIFILLFVFRFFVFVRKFFIVFFLVSNIVFELFVDLIVWFEVFSFICEVVEVVWVKFEVVFFLIGVFNWIVGWIGVNFDWKIKLEILN